MKVEGELKALPLAQTELNETDGRLTSEVRHCLNRFFYGVNFEGEWGRESYMKAV